MPFNNYNKKFKRNRDILDLSSFSVFYTKSKAIPDLTEWSLFPLFITQSRTPFILTWDNNKCPKRSSGILFTVNEFTSQVNVNFLLNISCQRLILFLLYVIFPIINIGPYQTSQNSKLSLPTNDFFEHNIYNNIINSSLLKMNKLVTLLKSLPMCRTWQHVAAN